MPADTRQVMARKTVIALSMICAEPSGWKMVMPDQMRAMGQLIRNSMSAR